VGVSRRAAGGGLFLSYFGGAGVNPSRLRPGSGFGLGFGAFLTSFLPLSLLPMGPSVPQEGGWGKAKRPNGVGEAPLEGTGMRLWGFCRQPEGDGILLVFRHPFLIGAGLRFWLEDERWQLLRVPMGNVPLFAL